MRDGISLLTHVLNRILDWIQSWFILYVSWWAWPCRSQHCLCLSDLTKCYHGKCSAIQRWVTLNWVTLYAFTNPLPTWLFRHCSETWHITWILAIAIVNSEVWWNSIAALFCWLCLLWWFLQCTFLAKLFLLVLFQFAVSKFILGCLIAKFLTEDLFVILNTGRRLLSRLLIGVYKLFVLVQISFHSFDKRLVPCIFLSLGLEWIHLCNLANGFLHLIAGSVFNRVLLRGKGTYAGWLKMRLNKCLWSLLVEIFENILLWMHLWLSIEV